MAAVDAHCHLFPPAAAADPAAWGAARREARWAAMMTAPRSLQGWPTVAEMLARMEADGVAEAWLMGWYWEQPETCREQNAWLAGVARASGGRLRAFASVQPRDNPAAAADLAAALDAGCVGVGEVHAGAQGFAWDDPAWEAVCALAEARGAPVCLHVTDPAGRRHPGWADTPHGALLAFLARWPGVRFILAHWGGGLALRPWAEAERAVLGRCWFDTAAGPLLYGPEAWANGMAVAGPERVLFGTDYPLRLYPRRPGGPDFAGLLNEARAALPPGDLPKVLAGNARDVLRACPGAAVPPVSGALC